MECLAIGLKHKIYDRDMVSDFFASDLTQIYDRAKAGGLIDAIRRETEDKSFLAEYEGVVEILKKRLRKKRI